jgi:hypothetical protein
MMRGCKLSLSIGPARLANSRELWSGYPDKSSPNANARRFRDPRALLRVRHHRASSCDSQMIRMNSRRHIVPRPCPNWNNSILQDYLLAVGKTARESWGREKRKRFGPRWEQVSYRIGLDPEIRMHDVDVPKLARLLRIAAAVPTADLEQ